MKVRDIMTWKVESVGPEADLSMVARQMKELNVGSVPVVDGDQLVGIVTDRDIVIRAVAEGKDPRVEQARTVLTPSPRTVSPDADVQEVAKFMAREQIRRLPVVDNGKLVGIVALGDLAVDAGKAGKDGMVGDALEKISEPSAPRGRAVGD